MHKTLYMWLAAHIMPLGVKEAVEEVLHLHWTAHGSYINETLVVQRGNHPIAFFTPLISGDIGMNDSFGAHSQERLLWMTTILHRFLRNGSVSMPMSRNLEQCISTTHRR